MPLELKKLAKDEGLGLRPLRSGASGRSAVEIKLRSRAGFAQGGGGGDKAAWTKPQALRRRSLAKLVKRECLRLKPSLQKGGPAPAAEHEVLPPRKTQSEEAEAKPSAEEEERLARLALDEALDKWRSTSTAVAADSVQTVEVAACEEEAKAERPVEAEEGEAKPKAVSNKGSSLKLSAPSTFSRCPLARGDPNKQTDTQTNKQTHKHTNTQTDTQTHRLARGVCGGGRAVCQFAICASPDPRVVDARSACLPALSGGSLDGRRKAERLAFRPRANASLRPCAPPREASRECCDVFQFFFCKRRETTRRPREPRR